MADNLLSSEELAFINNLMNSTAQGTNVTPGFAFKIEGSPPASDLLTTLATHASLSLEAKFGNFRLSFPLCLSEDEFHAQHLHITAPIIYESGPKVRAWRLTLRPPLALQEADGTPTVLQIHELSPNGALIETPATHEAPDSFCLYLPLPDGDSLPISARRVRRTEHGMMAYALDFGDNQDAERLRHYLFNQHRQLHPELQAESSNELR